ncbi:MAG: c-type cytochrome biogenesis protein CcmI [Pseudomonadota bacterium]
MLIWIIIIAFALISVALAFSGLWFSRTPRPSADAGHEKALYNARISEIETDFELGRIDETTKEAAKAEHARKFLKLERTKSTDSSLTNSRTFLLMVVAMVFVPVFSFGLYGKYGSPESTLLTLDAKAPDTLPSFEELLTAAEKRLLEDPNDLRGWRVVAPIYIRIGEYGKAANALRNVMRLEGEKLETLLSLGESLVQMKNGEIDDEAFEIFKSISDQEPAHARATYFVALGEFQRGNAEIAREIWQSMASGASGEELWLPVVRRHLRELDRGEFGTSGITRDQLEQINQMVSGLAARLEEEPSDREGWERLIRSYMVLGRPEDASRAVQSAKLHFPEDQAFIERLNQMIPSVPGVEASQ